MNKLHQSLNIQIANWSLLYTKLHRFHWYVKGPHFFILHEKFEELYNESAEIVDEIAERLLAIGGKPAATMQEYVSTATLKETANEENANDMIATLSADFQQLKRELKELAKVAEENDDDVSNDLAIGLLAKIEKHLWMLNAYLD